MATGIVVTGGIGRVGRPLVAAATVSGRLGGTQIWRQYLEAPR
jgi:hypothetical protein